MTERFHSTLRMRYVGRVLSQWRARARLTGDVVADHLDWPRSKLSKLENATQTIIPADVVSLAAVYGVSEAERDSLVDDVHRAGERGWWLSYGQTVTAKQFDRYVDLESEARGLVTFEIDLIPGLLQTEDYAAALAHACTPGADDTQIQQRVELRKRRQARLFADHPIQFEAVVGETALRQQIGGPDVLRSQVTHISRIARLPNVSVRLIPFHVGAYPAMGHPFVIFRFPRPEWPDVAYQETLSSGLYLDSREDVERYTAAYTGLCERALSKEDTLAALDRLATAR